MRQGDLRSLGLCHSDLLQSLAPQPWERRPEHPPKTKQELPERIESEAPSRGRVSTLHEVGQLDGVREC